MPVAKFSRRSFLARSSVAVAAAAAAAPALPGLLGSAASDAPALDGEAAAVAAPVATQSAGVTGEIAGPVLAEVKDAATGEISVYAGTQEISYRDPELAARLLRVATAG